MTKRKNITEYIGILKENNSIATASTKSGIAWFLGVSYRTIHRHIDNTDYYECEKYIIYKNVPHIKARTKSII